MDENNVEKEKAKGDKGGGSPAKGNGDVAAKSPNKANGAAAATEGSEQQTPPPPTSQRSHPYFIWMNRTSTTEGPA